MWNDEDLNEKTRKLAREVGQAMDKGFGRIPARPSPSEKRFLDAARRRLLEATENQENWLQEAGWLQAMGDPTLFPGRMTDDEVHRWRRRAGLTNASPQAFHGYAFLYDRVASLHTWQDPVIGILHQTVQRASSDALWVNAAATEPVVNTSLVNRLHASAKEVVEAVNESAVEIPEGCAFTFLAADMQGTCDHLDSDVAFVIGTYVDGKPMYRVCLLQAKWRPRDGGDIGQNAGRQLAGLVSTGMGFYLFYPRPGHTRGLGVASVRRAEDVRHDVWSRGERPSYGTVNPLVGGPNGSVASDFPYFVAVEMTSGVSGLGKLFPDEISVARTLQAARKLGFKPEVFVADTTERLLIQRFVPLLDDMFDNVHEPFGLRPAAEPRNENGFGS